MAGPTQSSYPVSRGRSAVVAWVALGVLMVISSALILYMGRGLTFFRDEWSFVIYRDGHDVANFLSSYAGHLLLWPVTLFLFMFKTVGLDHYEWYRSAALPWHLACAFLVYLSARRRVGDVVAIAPAGILLFLGSSWMDILWPFQIAFTGAIAFGLGAILALDRDDLIGDVLACLCLLIAIGWSAAALPFLPGVAVGLLVRRRFWRRLWVVAVPAVGYLLWLRMYGGDQQLDYAENLAHAPGYVLRMAGAGITDIAGLPASLGPWLAALLGLLVAVRLWQLGRSSPLAWEALAMAIAFWGLTALARAQENDPGAVRYVYPTAVFLLLLAVGVAPLGAPRRAAAFAVLALAVLTVPSNLSGFQEGRDDLLFTSNVTSAELGALQLAREVVSPEYAPELNGYYGGVPAGAFFAATDRYESSPADSPREIAESPEYARKRADRVSIQALRIHLARVPGSTRIASEPPCLRLSGTDVGPGMVLPRRGILVKWDDGVEGSVQLRRFASDFVELAPIGAGPRHAGLLRPVADGERVRPWRFRVVLERGSVSLCAVAQGVSRAST